MIHKVVLSIEGRQSYQDQEPEVIELVTEGEMEFHDGGWDIRYAESDLTGLNGVTTTFRVEAGKITLTRIGALNSQMVFQMGVPHDSLYQMEFGALMITVNATKIQAELGEQGGTVDLCYDIQIEQTAAGKIEYHLQINAK